MKTKQKVKIFVNAVAKKFWTKGSKNAKRLFHKAVENLSKSSLKDEIEEKLEIYEKLFIRKHAKYSRNNESTNKKEKKKKKQEKSKQKKEINLPFNLYDKKHSSLDRILEKSEDEQHKYAFGFIQQNWSNTKTEDLETFVSMSGKSALGRIRRLSSLCMCTVSRTDMTSLQDMMKIFLRDSNHGITKAIKKNDVKKLSAWKAELHKMLVFSSMKWSQSDKVCLNKPSIEDIMTALMSLYFDVIFSLSQGEETQKTDLRLLSSMLFAVGNTDLLLDVMSQQSVISDHLTVPLVRKALQSSPKSPEAYTKMITVVHRINRKLDTAKWRDLVQQVLLIPAPENYISWIRGQSTKQLHEMPVRKNFKDNNITSYLLQEASDEFMDGLLELLIDEEAEDMETEEEIQSTDSDEQEDEPTLFVIDKEGAAKDNQANVDKEERPEANLDEAGGKTVEEVDEQVKKLVEVASEASEEESDDEDVQPEEDELKNLAGDSSKEINMKDRHSAKPSRAPSSDDEKEYQLEGLTQMDNDRKCDVYDFRSSDSADDASIKVTSNRANTKKLDHSTASTIINEEAVDDNQSKQSAAFASRKILEKGKSQSIEGNELLEIQIDSDTDVDGTSSEKWDLKKTINVEVTEIDENYIRNKVAATRKKSDKSNTQKPSLNKMDDSIETDESGSILNPNFYEKLHKTIENDEPSCNEKISKNVKILRLKKIDEEQGKRKSPSKSIQTGLKGRQASLSKDTELSANLGVGCKRLSSESENGEENGEGKHDLSLTKTPIVMHTNKSKLKLSSTKKSQVVETIQSESLDGEDVKIIGGKKRADDADEIVNLIETTDEEIITPRITRSMESSQTKYNNGVVMSPRRTNSVVKTSNTTTAKTNSEDIICDSPKKARSCSTKPNCDDTERCSPSEIRSSSRRTNGHEKSKNESPGPKKRLFANEVDKTNKSDFSAPVSPPKRRAPIEHGVTSQKNTFESQLGTQSDSECSELSVSSVTTRSRSRRQAEAMSLLSKSRRRTISFISDSGSTSSMTTRSRGKVNEHFSSQNSSQSVSEWLTDSQSSAVFPSEHKTYSRRKSMPATNLSQKEQVIIEMDDQRRARTESLRYQKLEEVETENYTDETPSQQISDSPQLKRSKQLSGGELEIVEDLVVRISSSDCEEEKNTKKKLVDNRRKSLDKVENDMTKISPKKGQQTPQSESMKTRQGTLDRFLKKNERLNSPRTSPARPYSLRNTPKRTPSRTPKKK